ncbi:MAG: argininosuccinate lyase [Flavobacteriales bacterium]
MTAQRLWQKDSTPHAHLDRFTAGQDRVLDNQLARFDVLGSIAHATMLHRCGLLSGTEAEAILRGLRTILAEVDAGTFTVAADVEDIHSQVEITLTQRIGEAGKKLHTARSRNDQVLLDIKLYIRDRIAHTVAGLQGLFDRLLAASERYRSVAMPGYTHTQIAMPSTFGLWFAAHAESLTDDLDQLLAAYRIADRNPLGSAAGFGSSFPIDRQFTTELLGFSDLNVNVVYAQSTRGRTERATLNALAAVASSLGKLAADAVQYIGGEHGFLYLPDALTTGSSIMPHKKNPDGFELVRAHCNLLQGLPNTLALVLANLTTGYHRDLQVTKELLFPAFEKLDDCIAILGLMVDHLEMRREILADPKYAHLFTVDAVHALVKQGVPFRDAYRQVGQAVADGSFRAPEGEAHTHLGSAGDLRNDLIAERFARTREAFACARAERALAALERG